MSRPRFLADEDLNHAIVRGLIRREPSVEFATVVDTGLAGTSDDGVLDFAAENSLLLVSHDVNTMRALAEKRGAVEPGTYGLLLVPQSAPIGAVIDSLHLIWSVTDDEDWRNRIEFLQFK